VVSLCSLRRTVAMGDVHKKALVLLLIAISFWSLTVQSRINYRVAVILAQLEVSDQGWKIGPENVGY